jgi:putative ABC transport system permease protein
MLIGETIGVAFSSIRANKLRAALTMLGIIIGVGAVITMVALGTGAQKAVNDRIAALGASVFYVYPGQSFRGSVASNQRVSLTYDDYLAVKRDGHLLEAVMPQLQNQLQIKYGSQNLNEPIIGTTANFISVLNYTIPYGRSFTEGEDNARQRYAVLGSSIPDLLGVNPAALINQTILIRGIPFEVIGVLNSKGSAGSFNDPDEQIFIPLQTARFRVFGTDRLRSLGIQVKANLPLQQGMVNLESVLRREHRIQPGADNDFQIRNPQDILQTQQQATEVFTYLLASIAAVSLMVGGIGIMNIMLVSVTERTKEIGVRKALGATRANILLQFLIEAVVLCMVGGILGILIGSGGAIALARVLHWNTLISPTAVVVAFFFSAAVGLFFGAWPASRAAKLDPIDALRWE